MRILILHDEVPKDARKDEQDVLVQADVVRTALESLGHETHALGLTLDLAAAASNIRSITPDLVFNLVESVAGTGRLIHLAPALLDSLNIPYTGAPTEAMFQTSNKLLAKHALRADDLATPLAFSLAELRAGASIPSGRYIIKSVWEHASVGLDEDSVVDVDDGWGLLAEVEGRLGRLMGDAFAESYIDGREFNLALLANPQSDIRTDSPPPPDPDHPWATSQRPCHTLPPAEILFQGYDESNKPRVVGYRAKWEEASFEYHNTPRRFDFGDFDTPTLWEMQDMAERCWSLFNLRGYARVDFRVDEHTRPWILEVNTNPCLSPDAGYAAALGRAQISLTAAIARIVEDAGCRGG